MIIKIILLISYIGLMSSGTLFNTPLSKNFIKVTKNWKYEFQQQLTTTPGNHNSIST